jgi:uncharacterized protein (DUF2147 family)
MRLSLIFSIVLAAAFLSGCGKHDYDTRANSGEAGVDAAPTAERAINPELQKLRGNWMRVDGDYVLEIAEVDRAGKMTARYFNPGPIHVSKALGMRDSSETKVFVELQDTGYPGCTYSLTYDAASDQLHGQYWQAAMQRTYDVVFARLKQE